MKRHIMAVIKKEMSMKKQVGIIMLLVGLLAPTIFAEIVTETITYEANGKQLKGFLAYNNNIVEKSPVVLIVHEWWGLNEYVKYRAKKTAELGYVAFALDMYGNGEYAKHPDDAKGFANLVRNQMDSVGKERFTAGLNWIQNHPLVDSDNIAAIGYCFGGGTVLHMARFGFDLKGVVSFHGGLSTNTPAERGKVKAKVLVCHGVEDSFVSDEEIDLFKNEMSEAKVDYQFISYPNALHGFTNPDADKAAEEFGLGVAYNEKADQDSWNDMKNFLERVFGE